MAESSSIGSIIAFLGLDTKGLEEGASKGTRSLKDMDNAMAASVAKGQILGDVIADLAKKFFALLPTAMENIGAQKDLARSLGATTAATQAMKLYMEDAGVAGAKFEMSMKFLNKSLGEAIIKGGPAADMMKKLGLNANELVQMDLDERFATIADAIGRLGTQQERAAAAAALFGAKAGNDMTLAIIQGGDAARAASIELERMGVLLSDVDAESVDRAGDSMQRVQDIFSGFINRVVVKIAPYLEVISEKLKQAAVDSGGFGSAIDTAFSGILTAAGFVGDVIHSLGVVFEGVKVIALGFSAAAISAVEAVATAIAAVLDYIPNKINSVIDALNQIEGVDIPRVFTVGATQVMADIHSLGDGMRNVVAEARDELQKAAMEPLPSDGIKNFLLEVQDTAMKTSQATVDAVNQMQGVAGAMGPSDDDAAASDKARKEEEREKEKAARQAARIAEEQAREQERYKQQTEALKFAMATELEQELMHYEAKQLLLIQALEAKSITQQEYDMLEEQLTSQHMDRLVQINQRGMSDIEKFKQKSAKAQTQQVLSQMVAMTAGVTRENRAMFEVNKAAAMANAIISAYQGISTTLATYPYPLSIAMAALQGVAAFAQVSAISSTSFGSSAAPSVAGTTSAPPTSPVGGGAGGGQGGGGGGERGGGTLAVSGLAPGAMFSGEFVRELAQKLIDYQKDGGTVVFEQ